MHTCPFSLPVSEFPMDISPNALFCTKIALKLLNWHNLPGGVPPGPGEAVSEVVSSRPQRGNVRCFPS